MTAEHHIRFERLASLNIERISSTEEDLELWRLLEESTDLKRAFLQMRSIHYLLKVYWDPMASETAFVNRIKNALRPGRLSENDFTAAVQNKLQEMEPRKKMRVVRVQFFRIAASIVIALTCAALYFNLFSQDKNRLPAVSESGSIYLAWTYKPQISKLKGHLVDFYPSLKPIPYLDRMPDNQVTHQIKQMNQKITRSEILWR